MNKQILSRATQLIYVAAEINETTTFGVDVDLGFVNEGFEFRLYQTKEITQNAILVKTIYLNGMGDTEANLAILEESLESVLKTGKVFIPELID